MMNVWNKVQREMDVKMIRIQTGLYKRLQESRFSLSGNNAGMGVIEVVLIILVLVGLAFTFKSKISGVLNSVFTKITTKINSF
jgi:uncharacterized membrane protein YkgB